MRLDVYSNKDLIELRDRLNKEILRRGGFKWFDPLSSPKVGEDKSSPLSFPDTDTERVYVDDTTYTVNNPSIGSKEPTKNIHYQSRGQNPAGCDYEFISNNPSTSAAKFTVDEIKNFIIGLTKIDDVNLFYGQDETIGLPFRDLSGVNELLTKAENDKLNSESKAICRFFLRDDHLFMESFVDPEPNVIMQDGHLILDLTGRDDIDEMATFQFVIEDGILILKDPLRMIYDKNDPNGGLTNELSSQYPVQDFTVYFSVENGIFVLPSGEYDGEELTNPQGLGPDNFFDDYGAQPGDGNFHPYNRHISPIVKRHFYDQDNDRKEVVTVNIYGGKHSSIYGTNPRNPNMGEPFKSKPAYKGTESSCNSQCTGLCLETCDNICSESCTETCTYRCGNICTASCGNVCTGCNSLCQSSCKTMCENISGYACINAGAKAVRITTEGGSNGVPARNTISAETHSCEGCSYSCQFYPNKKTDCWDAGCMSKCFTTCSSACSTSCLGGCIDNENQNTGEYKRGIGRGCSSNCTVNCIGSCQGVCEGACTTTCWHGCKDSCHDSCSWDCDTACGNGCALGCKNGCTGCHSTCEGSCKGSAEGLDCAGCGTRGGCTSFCQHDCSSSCLGEGCRAICGMESAGACESNCRMSCMSSSCTARCSDACSSTCSTCVNTCNLNCGMCTSQCSASCGENCAIICTIACAHSCESDCLNSCREGCSSCSNLCYSCVAMCIGICSLRCTSNCSSCTKTCGWWCDTACNQRCFNNCDDMCLSSCSQNCSTTVTSDTTKTSGPAQSPTSSGYPVQHPANRIEELASLIILKE